MEFVDDLYSFLNSEGIYDVLIASNEDESEMWLKFPIQKMNEVKKVLGRYYCQMDYYDKKETRKARIHLYSSFFKVFDELESKYIENEKVSFLRLDRGSYGYSFGRTLIGL